MFYSKELQFLCNIMKKIHIQVSFTAPNDPISRIIDKDIISVFENFNIVDIPTSTFTGKVEPNTVYKTLDPFRLCYIYLLLPETAEKTLLFIGPFNKTVLSPNELLEISEKNHLSPKNQKILNEYYSSIPLLPDDSHLSIVLDSFYETIWGVNNFSVIDVEQERFSPASPINEEADSNLDDTLININLMEKRYSYENELIQAVTLGQIHKVDLLLSGLNELSFEKRTSDPLRNMKNYCIIMNTLFRKAAENGGVRPIYLDRVSSAFAVRIEQISSLSNITGLMKEIFRSYCRLVRNHSMKNYSPIVQRTIIFIESDLSANLTLSSLAEVQNVSRGYLSTIFKKETGKTVTEYIRDKRIKHATYLLSATHLQIQTIALHCGIMDVQYFSKTFKKLTGKTPKEYRESTKQNSLFRINMEE